MSEVRVASRMSIVDVKAAGNPLVERRNDPEAELTLARQLRMGVFAAYVAPEIMSRHR